MWKGFKGSSLESNMCMWWSVSLMVDFNICRMCRIPLKVDEKKYCKGCKEMRIKAGLSV